MRAPPHMLDVEQKGQVAVFYTHGYLDDECGELIAKKFEEFTEIGFKKFLFDLGDSKTISTLGVAILIQLLEDIMRSDGIMAFCNCNAIVKTTLTIMGLKKYTTVYNDQTEALEAMENQ